LERYNCDCKEGEGLQTSADEGVLGLSFDSFCIIGLLV
jgi:hypothetical protein